MNAKTLLAPLALTMVFSTGCGPLIGLPVAILLELASSGSYDESYDSTYGVQEFWGLRDATIRGDIGPLSVDTEARITGTTEQYGDTRTDRIVVEAYIGDQWAMMGLDVFGGLNHPSLATGQPIRFDAAYADSDAELHVTGLGCSNTSVSRNGSAVDYDQPATAVTLTANDDLTDNTRHVHAEFELPDGQTATSDFVIPL